MTKIEWTDETWNQGDECFLACQSLETSQRTLYSFLFQIRWIQW
jgi:hypothetical protein